MKVFVALLLLVLAGCQTVPSTGPYAPSDHLARDEILAKSLTRQATDAKDPAEAESLLRRALEADLYYGPAHNNLGVLCLKRGKLYEAAGEFEWARKLMPGLPDPRMNLALTLERAGRTEDALAGYRGALEVRPDHLPTLQALARLQVRASRTDLDTRHALEQIALRSESPEWRDWARFQLARQSP